PVPVADDSDLLAGDSDIERTLHEKLVGGIPRLQLQRLDIGKPAQAAVVEVGHPLTLAAAPGARDPPLLPITEHMFNMLYMRSASNDLTARARIRDAAIRAFARDGFDAASMRIIAA